MKKSLVRIERCYIKFNYFGPSLVYYIFTLSFIKNYSIRPKILWYKKIKRMLNFLDLRYDIIIGF